MSDPADRALLDKALGNVAGRLVDEDLGRLPVAH